MDAITIKIVSTPADAANLDDLLWRILWQPLSLPRNVRQSFRIGGGEQLELVAKANGRIVGGLVAFWTSDFEVELRHLAVSDDAQNQGTGRRLVTALFQLVASKGCCRIHTTARSTSARFFRELGFRPAPGAAPQHPTFKKHGIVFELMDRIVEPAGSGDALQRA